MNIREECFRRQTHNALRAIHWATRVYGFTLVKTSATSSGHHYAVDIITRAAQRCAAGEYEGGLENMESGLNGVAIARNELKLREDAATASRMPLDTTMKYKP